VLGSAYGHCAPPYTPDSLVPMSPNRRDLEPSRQAERERLRRRGVLIRDVGLAVIFALVLFGLWKFVLGK
jgi:hypothetical protein